jgi:hypothetical protein
MYKNFYSSLFDAVHQFQDDFSNFTTDFAPPSSTGLAEAMNPIFVGLIPIGALSAARGTFVRGETKEYARTGRWGWQRRVNHIRYPRHENKTVLHRKRHCWIIRHKQRVDALDDHDTRDRKEGKR